MKQLHIEVEQEEDGRWTAEVVDLPGVMAYGATTDEAIRRVKSLALRVLADKVEVGELPEQLGGVFALQPLDLGEVRHPVSADDDLLDEMLGGPRLRLRPLRTRLDAELLAARNLVLVPWPSEPTL